MELQRYRCARAALAEFDNGTGNDDDADELLDALLDAEHAIARQPARDMRDVQFKIDIAKAVTIDEHAGGPLHHGVAYALLCSIRRDLLAL
jgi:hypothetical protein